jgi:hypothetical protein
MLKFICTLVGSGVLWVLTVMLVRWRPSIISFLPLTDKLTVDLYAIVLWVACLLVSLIIFDFVGERLGWE